MDCIVKFLTENSIEGNITLHLLLEGVAFTVALVLEIVPLFTKN
jgi:hypothetical protein